MAVEKLTISDVDELAYSVDPWDVRMCQLSPGKLNAVMEAAAFGDIFITSERWSQKITANGQTPPGYLALAGPVTGRGFAWGGRDTSQQRLAYSMDANEIDFITWDEEHHWTALLPINALRDYLGEDVIHTLSQFRTEMYVDPTQSCAVCNVVLNLLSRENDQQSIQSAAARERSGRSLLLMVISKLLLNAASIQIEAPRPSNRARAYQKARDYLATLDDPITVGKLARHTGVSRRCLEICFKEAMGISPGVFMRRKRLNAFRQELLHAPGNSTTVTAAAQKWGFTELGRVAGNYREMFGELPSDTMAKKTREPVIRYADLIVD